VDVLIVGLRKKLGEAGVLIETVRGAGYKFREQ
jgi:two-component system phosphate regulon response regulator PhoB